jgi:aconitase A
LGAIPAYHSNGPGLNDPELLGAEVSELAAEGGFTGLKLASVAIGLCDLAAIDAVWAIVGGFNYGMGSSCPAASSLRNLGIAESITGSFFRTPLIFRSSPSSAPGFMRPLS